MLSRGGGAPNEWEILYAHTLISISDILHRVSAQIYYTTPSTTPIPPPIKENTLVA